MNSKRADKIATIVFYAISIFIVTLLGAFIAYILYKGGSMLKPSFLFGKPKISGAGGGIGPQLFNSFYMLIISLLITIPIGIGAGIYLAEYAKQGPIVGQSDSEDILLLFCSLFFSFRGGYLVIVKLIVFTSIEKSNVHIT